MLVLPWLNFHHGHTPADIAKGLRAEEDVDEIAKLCADLETAGFIEPMPPALKCRSGARTLLR